MKKAAPPPRDSAEEAATSLYDGYLRAWETYADWCAQKGDVVEQAMALERANLLNRAIIAEMCDPVPEGLA